MSLSEDLPDLTYSPTDSVKFQEDEYGWAAENVLTMNDQVLMKQKKYENSFNLLIGHTTNIILS